MDRYTAKVEGGPKNTFLSDKVVHDANESRRKLSHPSVLDQSNVLQWMKSENIWVVGLYLEADQQLHKLEMDGIVDAIATEDGDLVVLGGQKVLSKSYTRGGELMFRIFDREELFNMRPHDCHISKFFLYPEAGIDLALLLGNDYREKVKNVGTTSILEDRDWIHQRRGGPKIIGNGSIDHLARH